MKVGSREQERKPVSVWFSSLLCSFVLDRASRTSRFARHVASCRTYSVSSPPPPYFLPHRIQQHFWCGLDSTLGEEKDFWQSMYGLPSCVSENTDIGTKSFDISMEYRFGTSPDSVEANSIMNCTWTQIVTLRKIQERRQFTEEETYLRRLLLVAGEERIDGQDDLRDDWRSRSVRGW